HSQERPKPCPLEFATPPRNETEQKNNRHQSESVGVFAEEAKANKQSSDRPIPATIGSSFQPEPEREHRRCPKEDRKRVDGHHQISNGENRCHIQCYNRPESDGSAKEATGKVIENETCSGAKKWAPETDAKFRRSKNRRTRPDGESNTRTLAKISGSQS